MLLPGEGGGRLHEHRRFADAGIAADEQGGAANETTAGGAIKLGYAGLDARSVLDLA